MWSIQLCSSFSIVFAIWDLLHFHTNITLTCSSFVKNAIGILIGIALNLYTVFLGSIVILTVLTLLVYAHGISFRLCCLQSFFSSVSHSFLSTGLLPPCLHLFLSFYSFWCNWKWVCLLNTSISDSLLSVYRSSTDFCILILYPETLLNSCTSCNSFLEAVFTIFYIYSIMLSTVTILLLSSQLGFLSLPCLIAMAGTSSIMLNKSSKIGHPCLIPYFRGYALKLFTFEYDIGCRFVIYVEGCSLCTHFVESLHKWILNFVKSFFCLYWGDHMTFICQFVNVVYHTVLFVDIKPF